MVKIVKVLVRVNSKHLQKATFPMFETETVGPCLVWKLKWGLVGGAWSYKMEDQQANTLTKVKCFQSILNCFP